MVKLLSILAISISCFYNPSDKDLVKAFYNDIQETNKDDMEKVVHKYLLLPTTVSLTSEHKEMLIAQLIFIKEKIKSVDLNEIVVDRLNDSDFMFPTNASRSSMYEINYKRETLFYIWIDSSKIKSFNIMNKSGKKYFIPVF